MRHSRIFGTIAAVGFAVVGLAGSHVALATDGFGGNHVSWLSGVGDDANPCSRTAPCKTLNGAFNKTSQPDGEINVEDPGNFATPSNTLTNTVINGGIIVNGSPGIVSLQVSVAGLDGLDIAAAPDDVVILRHLDIEGYGIGLHGINFISGKALYIEDSVIQNFTGDAVHVNAAAGGLVVLDNVSLRRNGGNGVNASGGSPSALASVTIKHSRIEGNTGAGVLAADYSDVIVDDSTVSGNAQGLACVPQAAGKCVITASTNVIGRNTTGVLSGRGVAESTGSAVVYLTDNKIVANGRGMSLTAVASTHGKILSFGDNTVVDNGQSGSPTGTATKL